jgi:hypothetical protein
MLLMWLCVGDGGSGVIVSLENDDL